MIRKIHITFLLFCIVVNGVFAQLEKTLEDCSDQIDFSWVTTGGGSLNDEAYDVATDSEGNIYATGYFTDQINIHGNVVIGHNSKDMYVAKLSPDGDIVWIEAITGENEVYGTGIGIDDNNNVYVTGTFSGNVDFDGEEISAQSTDIFLVKYNSDGDYIWGNFFGGFGADISGTLSVRNNYIHITGTYFNSMFIDGTTITSNGGNDFFVAKYNSEGSLQWVTEDGSNSDAYGRKITTDINGNVIFTGQFAGEISFGTINLQSEGVFDVFVGKYSPNGDPLWIRSVGSPGNVDRAGDVDTDINGNVFVCLHADQGAQRGKIQKLSADGINLSSFRFGNTDTYPAGISVSSTGDFYVTGNFSGTADFGDGSMTPVVGEKDIFITLYNDGGDLRYKYTAGSAEDDAASAITIDLDNNIIISGFCNNAIYFGPNLYYSQGQKDMLVAKFEKFFDFSDIIISSINCDPENMCVDLEITGGEPPYSFLWSDGQTTESVCGLSTGEYSVTVSDSEDCFIETTINITTPEDPVINLPPVINICPHSSGIIEVETQFDSYVWSTGETTQSIEVSTPGNYYLTVTDSNGCTAESSTNVNIIPEPNLLVNDEEYICPGEDISFSLQGFEEYLWSNGSTNPTFITSEQGIHWVRVFDGECYYYDTIVIMLYPQPEVDIGGDVLICPGDTAFFDAGPSFIRYLWHDESDEQFYHAIEAELVSVKVTDSNGCEAEDSAIVNMAEAPYVDLGQDTILCKEPTEPFLLYPNDVAEDNTYQWSNGSTDDFIEVYSTGNYWVIVTNNQGCTASDTVFLRIFPAISLDLGNNVEFCEGESHTFAVEDEFDQYLWSDNSTDTSLTVYHTGVVGLTVTSSNGCVANDSVFVYEHVMPDPYLGEDTVLCKGTSIFIFPAHDYLKYTWQDGSTDDEFHVTQPGEYGLTVTNDFGCSKSTHINIDYAENPVIDQANVHPSNVEIIATGGTPPYIYTHNQTPQWQQTHTFHGLNLGDYTIIVRDQNYCEDSVNVTVEGKIEIPSFFTPNGDGYNDYWEIEGIYNFPTAEIQIFDRFGKKLAEFNGNNMRWDGRYIGQLLPSDTYWYVIRLQDGIEPITGHVTLKR